MSMHYTYPATLEADGTGYMLGFVGLPGATWGETAADALQHARDLLTTSLEMILEDGETPPPPPPACGRPIIEAEV